MWCGENTDHKLNRIDNISKNKFYAFTSIVTGTYKFRESILEKC